MLLVRNLVAHRYSRTHWRHGNGHVMQWQPHSKGLTSLALSFLQPLYMSVRLALLVAQGFAHIVIERSLLQTRGQGLLGYLLTSYHIKYHSWKTRSQNLNRFKNLNCLKTKKRMSDPLKGFVIESLNMPLRAIQFSPMTLFPIPPSIWLPTNLCTCLALCGNTKMLSHQSQGYAL